MENGNGRKAEETFLDLQSYPILTEEIGSPSAPPGGRTGSGSPGAQVQSVVRDVLGWRPRAGDAKGFLSALTNAFAVKEVDGHVTVTWTPKSYTVQADLGTVTGAQASIYARAKVAIDQALPLLDGLYPLTSDFDSGDADAIRAVIRTEVAELVDELGVAGGPRVQRVDSLLDQLVGYRPGGEPSKPADPERVGGQLGLLRRRFGLRKNLVNTITEEQNLTNFRIFVNYVDSLRQSWDADRSFFNRKGTDVFLGTQLVLLSRSLAVIAESVGQVRFAMDSVFLGEAEREVTPLTLDGEIIMVGELLRWAEHFATIEGPRYIEDGGKDGIEQAFVPTLSRLQTLVEEAFDISSKPSPNPVKGFHTARVSRALDELRVEVTKANALAADVRRSADPQITGVTPNMTLPADPLSVTIFGTGFEQGARVWLGRDDGDVDDVHPENLHVIAPNMITAWFALGHDDAVGTWDVYVRSRTGQKTTRRDALTVIDPYWPFRPDRDFDRGPTPRNGGFDAAVPVDDGAVAMPEPEPEPEPAPSIERIDPVNLSIGDEQLIMVVGTHLDEGTTVSFGRGTESAVRRHEDDGKTLWVMVKVNDNANPGPRDVKIETPDGQKVKLRSGFKISRR